MAVIAVGEMGMVRRGKLDDTYSREYTRKWRVRTSSALDDASVVLAAVQALVPIYSPYPTDAYALLKSLEAQELDTPTHWEVQGSYGTRTADQTQQSADPVEEPPEITYTTERIESPLQKDLNGYALVNAAGDPFDPPPVVEDGYDLLNISIKKPFFTRSFASAYRFHFNSAAIWGAQPKYVLCTQFDGKRGIKNGIPFWTWSLQFKFKANPGESELGAGAVGYQGTWENVELLNAGFRYWDDGSEEAVMITDRLGQPLSKPSLLDATGGVISSREGTGANYLNFRVKLGANFNDLGLPGDL